MRRIYTCLLELADAVVGRAPGRPGADEALGRAGRTAAGPSTRPSGGSPSPGSRSAGGCSTTRSGADEAFELVWTRPHAQDPTLWRRATVQITTTGSDGRVLVLEQLESADPKVRAAPAQRVRRAGARRRSSCARSRASTAAGASSADAAPRRRAPRAPDLDAFVRGDRRLPVVLVAPDAQGAVLRRRRAVRGRTSSRSRTSSCSTASAAVAALDAELGAGRGAPSGGVRLLWPSWRSSDPPRPPPELAGRGGRRARRPPGPRGGDRSPTSCVGAATLRVEGDPLVERLARSQETVDLQERRVELESLRTAVLGRPGRGRGADHRVPVRADPGRRAGLPARGGPRTRARAAGSASSRATSRSRPAATDGRRAAGPRRAEREPRRGRAAGQGDAGRTS